MLCFDRTIGRVLASITALAMVLGDGYATAAGWERAHADGANSGFADVVTAPADKVSLSVPGLGHFAAGAGPVIAANGTVYLGTTEGRLIALKADGSPLWSRQLNGRQSIMASPAIGGDGSIHVVGTRYYTDHRGGTTAVIYESSLYKFSPAGAMQWSTPFPAFTVLGKPAGTGGTTAPPNIWSFLGTELVMVPVIYKDVGRQHLHLVAFSADGAVVANRKVSTIASLIGCLRPGFDFVRSDGSDPANALPPRTVPPLPGVAIFTYPGGGAPWIIVSDQSHDIVGYTYSAGKGFLENFRASEPSRQLASPPMVLPDGHSVVGAAGKRGAVVFAGPNMNKLPPVTGLRSVWAAPTRTVDGLVIVMENSTTGGFAVLNSGKRVSFADLPGQSIVSPAASRTHLFVATANAFYTFDAAGQIQLAKFDWVGGGAQTPAIGPDGRVYAIAANILFIFPAPRTVSQETAEKLQGATVAVATTSGAASTPKPGSPKLGTGLLQPQDQQVATSPASQTFQPPLTKSGKRLYACQDFAGNGCGAPVAAAFCKQQGFVKAAKLDTQSQKVQAETLDGQLCSKKKCRVFDLIVCAR
jgi:hypothetical protein